MRRIRLPLRFAAVAIVVWLVGVVPAAACGCGAYIPREGDAHVQQERALVRWDGTTEDIVMSLSVAGRSAEAAWILPVPAAAEVTLADAALFEALQEFTKPEERIEHRSMGDGMTAGSAPGSPPVTVLERQQLGPFDVSTLAATDADALSTWLATNGYQFPEQLADALQPYIEQAWLYVAVRLTPAAADGGLTGDLDPIQVTFATDEMVYPMRLSALAQNRLPVYLYVLADHRVELANTERAGANPRVQFAGWVDEATVGAESPIAPFVPRRMFLTKLFAEIDQPSQIADDWRFSFAASDEAFRDTVVRVVYDPVPWWQELAWPGASLVLLGILVVIGVMFVRRRGARTAR